MTSPTKRRATTRLLEVLSFLVFHPFPTSSIISTAAIFHSIDIGQVTLLIDEFDALTARLGDDQGFALRAVLNSGYRRRFAFITRVNSRYNTFAPIVFALISQRPLSDTLQDRSIEVRLKRRAACGTGRKTSRQRQTEPGGRTRSVGTQTATVDGR